MQAFAVDFFPLIPLRAVIGASQAFNNPAAYTLISEIFPKRMVGTINGVFSSGIYLGGGLASLSIILDGYVGWRQTMLIVGGIGLVAAAACLFLIEEPRALPAAVAKREAADAASAVAVVAAAAAPVQGAGKSMFNVQEAVAALQDVLASPDAQLILIAAALRFCAGFSIAIWKAPFVFAKFPGSESAFAGSNAAVVATGGFLSSLIGGYISDRLATPNDPTARPRARMWVPAVGSLLAAPLWAAFIAADQPSTAVLCLLGEYLVAECWFGPALAALFQVVPANRRGTAQGLFSVLNLAGNVATVLVGALAGGQLGNFALGDVLIAVVSGAYALSGVIFAVLAVRDDARIADERTAAAKSS
jgi:sugar phosphate permease